MNGKLIVTVGLPRSGKSTWALDRVRIHGSRYVRVNRDELRMAMYGEYVLTGAQEKLVTRVQHAAIAELLAKGKIVIVDDTNLKQKTRTMLAELAVRCLADYQVIGFLHVSPEECKRRATHQFQEGGRGVPHQVIDDMARRYASLIKDGFPAGETLEISNTHGSQAQGLRNREGIPAIIVDIDGTVADHNGRDPYNVAQCGNDLLYKDTADIVKQLTTAPYTRVGQLIFVSGRDSKFMQETVSWLDKMGFQGYSLYMRREGDRRDDAVVKHEIYVDYILPSYDVKAVFDDRDRVVAMWRRLGLQVFQCNYGSF